MFELPAREQTTSLADYPSRFPAYPYNDVTSAANVPRDVPPQAKWILRRASCCDYRAAKTPGADRRVLSSYTIWLCLTCHTCVARCPMEVDLPKAMDILRAESLRLHLVHSNASDIVAFHSSFNNTIKRFGRLWEFGLICGIQAAHSAFTARRCSRSADAAEGKALAHPFIPEEVRTPDFF